MLKAKYGSDWRKKAGIKEDVDQVDERELTAAEKSKKEKYVMSLKGKMGGFKKRYGERAKEVMYATATKMAKEDVQPVNELEKSKYVDKVRDATDPSYGRGADHIIKKAGKEHGAKFAKDLEGIAYKSHFGRHKTQKSDPLKPLPGTSAPRVTKAGKMHSVDAKTMKDKIRARLGKHKKASLPESEQVAEVSTGLANRYLSKTQGDDKRQAGRAQALKKKWGGKVGGTEAPKVPTKD